jgi:hypothetical protein
VMSEDFDALNNTRVFDARRVMSDLDFERASESTLLWNIYGCHRHLKLQKSNLIHSNSRSLTSLEEIDGEGHRCRREVTRLGRSPEEMTGDERR